MSSDQIKVIDQQIDILERQVRALKRCRNHVASGGLERDKRNVQIFEMHQQGISYVDIGKLVSLSSAQCRNIVEIKIRRDKFNQRFHT